MHLIGLAKKAGRLEVGEEPVGAAARARHVRLLLVASDAAPGSVRRARHFAEAGQCLLLTVPCSKEELGRAVGCSVCAMSALTDIGFASAIVKRLALKDPKTYGPAAEALDVKAKRAMERQREQIRHEKNLRRGIRHPAPGAQEEASVGKAPSVQESRETEVPAPRREEKRSGFPGAGHGGAQKPPYRSHTAGDQAAGRKSGYDAGPAKEQKPDGDPRDKTGAKPYRRSDEGAKPYRRNGEGTKPYRRSDEGAKPYRRSNEGAKPYRRSGEGAKPYRRSDEGAKPYRRSGEGAKPYRRSDEGAKPYRRNGEGAPKSYGRNEGGAQGKAPGRPAFGGASQRPFSHQTKKAFSAGAPREASRFAGSRPVKRGKGSDHKQKN